MCGIVGNENIRSLWDGLARCKGDREFLVFEDCDGAVTRFTYAQFDALINRTANYFLELGVEKGENVAVQLYNSPEYLSVTFALAKIGAVSVPINMQHKVEECAFVFERCAVRVLVTEPDFQEFYYGEKAGCSMETVLVCHAAGEFLEQGAVDFDAEVARQPHVLTEVRKLDSHDVAEIMFTSGTTSCPKGVELTHYNLLYSGLYGDWEFCLTPEDRFLTTMPAFHSNFQTLCFDAGAYGGSDSRFLEEVQRASLLEAGSRPSCNGGSGRRHDGAHHDDAAGRFRRARASGPYGPVLPFHLDRGERRVRKALRRSSAELLRLHRIGVLGA